MPIEIDGEIYYSTDEACSYLGISRDILNRMIKDSRLHKQLQGFSRTIYYCERDLAALKILRKLEDNEDQEDREEK